jgi:hypothetical protein
MPIFNTFYTTLLKLSKIDVQKDILDLVITLDPATEQFFKGINFDGEVLQISLTLVIKNSKLETLELNSEVIESLENKASYINHVVDGQNNQVIFSFVFGKDLVMVKKLYLVTLHSTGEFSDPYSEADLQLKKDFIANEKQNIINIENVLEEKKNHLAVLNKELQDMKDENDKSVEFKKLVQDKLASL